MERRTSPPVLTAATKIVTRLPQAAPYLLASPLHLLSDLFPDPPGLIPVPITIRAATDGDGQ